MIVVYLDAKRAITQGLNQQRFNYSRFPLFSGGSAIPGNDSRKIQFIGHTLSLAILRDGISRSAAPDRLTLLVSSVLDGHVTPAMQSPPRLPSLYPRDIIVAGTRHAIPFPGHNLICRHTYLHIVHQTRTSRIWLRSWRTNSRRSQ